MSRKKRRKKKALSSSSKRLKKKRPAFNKLSLEFDTNLRKAIGYHQSGNLQEAQEIYRKILQVHPDHPVPLHLLGVIAHQVGQHDIAVELISKAIKNDPQDPTYYRSLGNAFQDQGKLNEAIWCYQKSVQLNIKKGG